MSTHPKHVGKDNEMPKRARTLAARRRLRSWLDTSKLSDGELASLLHISRPYMSQILHGDRRPGLDLLAEIYRVTGIPPVAWAEKSVSEMAGVGDR